MLILVRIDNRLIHGQVVVGWGNFLHPDRILLCNDEIASNQSERELYLACAPPDLKVSILSFKETAEEIANGTFNNEKVILIVQSPKGVMQLLNLGVEIKSVNIGGMHYSNGKRQLNSFIYVDDEEIESFCKLKEMGIELECRDVPTKSKEPLSNYIDLRSPKKP